MSFDCISADTGVVPIYPTMEYPMEIHFFCAFAAIRSFFDALPKNMISWPQVVDAASEFCLCIIASINEILNFL